MTLPEELLALAQSLLGKAGEEPRQADLRRAISTAYYALFHLLVDASTRLLLPGDENAGVRAAAARSFVHKDMRRVCEEFAPGSGGVGSDPRLALLLGDQRVPPSLREVAASFWRLQDSRHQADYDTAKRFSRVEATQEVDRAVFAFECWAKFRSETVSKPFLIALCLWNQLKAR